MAPITSKPDKTARKHSSRGKAGKARRNVFNRLVEDRLIDRVSYEEYRETVRDVYDGPQGAVLLACSFLSLHAVLGERLLRKRRFDLRGFRNILDVGSGAGQIAKHLLKYSDPEANITCFDLSWEMLRRARTYLRSDRPRFVVSDMTRLPFPDASFDCVTCGYVLEHLPDARMGLAELSRVMMPGARMLLLATEDTFSGAWTSRLWKCRTYNRHELGATCKSLDLHWKKELWFSRMHKLLRAGGICVELEKQ